MNGPISLIIPTYNERDNIVPLVERINRAMSGYDYVLVLIDDNSRDGTAELAASLAKKYPVRVVVRKDKRGLASAVVDGLQYVSGDIVGVMDADLQHPPEVLPELVKKVEAGADMVIASRYVKGGGCRGWGLTRRLMSKAAGMVAHVVLPSTRRINDPMSGFFMFNRRAVDGADLTPTGYKILLEMLVKGQFHNVAEVPYIFDTRRGGKSKLRARQQIDYLKHIYRLMRSSGELTRFLKFCLVGLSGVGVNEGLLWLLTERAGLQYLWSSAVGIETSIITNFIFNNFFTFRDRRSAGVKPTLYRLLKFNLVSLAGLGINLGVLWLFTNTLGIYYLLSNLIGIAVAALWNYALSNWWTWR